VHTDNLCFSPLRTNKDILRSTSLCWPESFKVEDNFKTFLLTYISCRGVVHCDISIYACNEWTTNLKLALSAVRPSTSCLWPFLLLPSNLRCLSIILILPDDFWFYFPEKQFNWYNWYIS
jgi:hypothetical protein